MLMLLEDDCVFDALLDEAIQGLSCYPVLFSDLKCFYLLFPTKFIDTLFRDIKHDGYIIRREYNLIFPSIGDTIKHSIYFFLYHIIHYSSMSIQIKKGE